MMTMPEDLDDLEPGDDADDEEAWLDAMCGMGPDGQCGQAGSEHCEFDCPYRDATDEV